ncbi:MAG: HAMP domain-containing histidine kinase [Lachnospiraceae bacterium]|nr:HAMP domain-containing histidine kinase [Lachnospiraceae bacterium]
MKKTIILIIHVLSILAFVAGFSAIYINNTGSSGITWVSAGDYSESPQFADAVNSDIEKLKKLALYSDVFGDIDEIEDGDGLGIVTANTPEGPMEYNVTDLIGYAESFGWSIDFETGNTRTTNAKSDAENFDIRVLEKKYDPGYLENLEPGPSQGVMSIKELSIDAVKTLSSYIILHRELEDTASNFSYILYYPGVNEECVIITNTDLRSDSVLGLPEYVHAVGSSETVDTSISPVPTAAVYTPFDKSDTESAEFYELTVGIDTSYPYSDRYSRAAAEFKKQANMAYTWIAVAVLGFVLAVITLIFILRDEAAEESAKHIFDRLPVEAFICIMAALSVLFYYLFKLTLCRVMEAMAPFSQQQYWRTVAKTLIVYGLSVLILGSCLRRYRTGTLYKTSLFNRLELAIEDYLVNSGTAGTLLVKFVAFAGINIFLAVEAYRRYSQRMVNSRNILVSSLCITVIIILDIFCYGRLFKVARQREKIDGALKSISEGGTNVDLSEDEFTGQELETARSINNISVGLMSAVSDQVKSERLKADLITNVSHDIKTPLTSIINYVGLLKRENINNEKANEYIDILERKSERLKNLTEDLVEASKASSGNIRIDFTKLDIVELSEQAAAEFEDKFSARGLEFCLTKPETPVFVNADGRHLWRVFENLFNNASKYSLEGTRVYGDVGCSGENAFFTIKNISAMKLNISPEELTERFVRGDISRTTEGSGLGLSIAKSLASLMGGELKIEIDGDLYKATVLLPVYKEPEDENQTY